MSVTKKKAKPKSKKSQEKFALGGTFEDVFKVIKKNKEQKLEKKA